MNIVGGIYREVCELPSWNAEFGSGGRAAAALCSYASDLSLHTYAKNRRSDCLTMLEALGVRVHIHAAVSGIAFAYFHSLSKPFVEPPLDQIQLNPPIEVEGEVVLRFGLMEGDAVVRAQRAVYDPQTSRNPAPFRSNGSTAAELAIVLNEDELFAFTGERHEIRATSKLATEQSACVIVVKQGAFGATVYERDSEPTWIPAFHTERVFKIGSGDVFSAGFAYHWGEKKLPAVEAALLASRLAATYCSNPVFPISGELGETLQPIRRELRKPILLVGKIDTMGRRYVMEEARFHLEALGADVICPSLDPGQELCNDYASALLVADGHTLSELTQVTNTLAHCALVVFDELPGRAQNAIPTSSLTMSTDFSSALYQVIWAGMS